MNAPQSKRALLLVEATAGVLIWLINAYRLATGLREMAFLDAVCAGMIFLFGPMLIWETVQRFKAI